MIVSRRERLSAWILGALCAAALAVLAARQHRAPLRIESGEAPSGWLSGGGRERVNLNAAAAADLQRLPGIGPALAQRIIEHRAKRGGFARVEELLEVPGIGERTLENLRGALSVDP